MCTGSPSALPTNQSADPTARLAPLREFATPTSETLIRIGREPDPLVWTPWEFVGQGRFDDPESNPSKKRYRVLYAGDRPACFLETLADFRPGLDGSLRREFTRDWLETRRIAEFVLDDPGRNWRWLDLRSPETHQALRTEFGQFLLDHRLTDFDISTATSEHPAVTQRIGAWCFERGYAGIAFMSRLDAAHTCWAIFERPEPDTVGLRSLGSKSIDYEDPDLRAVVELFGLPLPAR